MAQDIIKSNPEERTLGSSVVLGVVIGGLLGLGVGYMVNRAAEAAAAAVGAAFGGATKAVFDGTAKAIVPPPENHMITTILGSTPLDQPRGTMDKWGLEMAPYTESLATYLKRIGPTFNVKTEGPFSGDELANKLAALNDLLFKINSKGKPGEKVMLGIVESEQSGTIVGLSLNNMGAV